ncbi:MAG: hypothetical protein ACK5Z2_19310, partial [Bacteroidota bacterium]
MPGAHLDLPAPASLNCLRSLEFDNQTGIKIPVLHTYSTLMMKKTNQPAAGVIRSLFVLLCALVC